jgi:hypothetical protein
MPDQSRSTTLLAEIVIGVAVAIGLAEVLGALRLLHVAVLVIAAIGCAVTALWWERHTPGPEAGAATAHDPPQPRSSTAWISALLCALVVAILAAAWSAPTIASLHHGMTASIDSNWYHLPTAARFVQTGVVTDSHFLDSASLTAFYPASTPLLHALGIMLLGSDVLSPVLNLGFLALTLFSAWCLGRTFDVGPLAVVSVAAVLVTPMLSTTQPGGAYNDIAGIAFFVASLALLAIGRRERGVFARGSVGVAAVAAGLALGTKYNFILPVAALSVGVVVLVARGQRVRQAVTWTSLVILTGGFFYLRNLIIVGNPVPAVSLHVGPITLPSPPSGVEELAPVSVLGQRALWRPIFQPALRDGFGPLWVPLLILLASGIVLAIATRRAPFVRMLGIVAAVTSVAYLITPASIGTRRLPVVFVYSLRYAACAAVLAALALAVSSFGRRFSLLLTCAFTAVVVGTQFDPALWPTELRKDRFAEPVHGGPVVAAIIIGIVVLIGGCVGLMLNNRPARHDAATSRRTRYVAVLAVGLVAILVGGFVHEDYLRHRYAGGGYLGAIYEWARTVHDERIGVVGTPLQYPLYSDDLSNYVQYVGRRGSDGSFFPITSCRAWRRALASGRYDYVVTAPNPLIPKTPIEETWTRGDRAARVEIRDGHATVFRLTGPLDPAGCDRLSRRASP